MKASLDIFGKTHPKNGLKQRLTPSQNAALWIDNHGEWNTLMFQVLIEESRACNILYVLTLCRLQDISKVVGVVDVTIKYHVTRGRGHSKRDEVASWAAEPGQGKLSCCRGRSNLIVNHGVERFERESIQCNVLVCDMDAVCFLHSLLHRRTYLQPEDRVTYWRVCLLDTVILISDTLFAMKIFYFLGCPEWCID